ncbi:hypothetical protein D9M71_821030 [compost metagenome]
MGIEGCAPARVTDNAAATCPNRIAWASLWPATNAAAKPPTKVSPAAVVSSAFTLGAGKCSKPLPSANNDPWAPRVMMTLPAPISIRRVAAVCADCSESTGKPLSAAASLSLGIR